MKYFTSIIVALMVILAGSLKTIHIPNGVVKSQPTELERFLDHMAQRESDNTPHVVPYGQGIFLTQLVVT